MHILVTGGTGFLGKYVVEKLGKHKVIVFSRSMPTGPKKIAYVLGDITNSDELEKAFPADAVIHLAATLDEHDSDLFRVNVDGTRNVTELCKKYKVKHLIHMSSTAALGETKFAKEDSPRNPKTNYEKSKRDAEDVVMNSGLNYTIIRAPVIFGPSKVWLDVIKAAEKGFPIIGSGSNHFHVACVDDVASLIARCLGNKKAYGQIFHIATSDTPTYREFYTMLCKSLGIEMTKKSLPVTAVRIFSAANRISSKLRGKKPKAIMEKSNIDRIIRDRTVSTRKIQTSLRFKPATTKRAIRETVNYFKKSGLI
ncbi:MAG: NAD(P)-dependent oxidoreductase [Candidatus Aenigmatarchaeota archaeon]